VVLSLSLSSFLYSLAAPVIESDLASVSRRTEGWGELLALFGWKTFELGLGWWGGYDGYDLAALSLLSHGPPVSICCFFRRSGAQGFGREREYLSRLAQDVILQQRRCVYTYPS
jgi:hypothetical protein